MSTRLTNSSNYASATDLANLAHRLNALEASLVKTGALIPSDLEFYLTGMRSRLADFSSASDARPSDSKTARNVSSGVPTGVSESEEAVSDTEGAALTLEHLAFGRSRVDGSHSMPHFGARLPSTVGKPAPNNNYHLAKATGPVGASPGSAGLYQDHSRKSSLGVADGKGLMDTKPERGESVYLDTMTEEERLTRINALLDLLGPTDVFDMLYKKTDVAMAALTKVLPTRERGELLIKTVSDHTELGLIA